MRSTGTAPFYEHQTILEWFDNWSISNIAPEDIREAYRTTHGLTSTAAITTHFIGTYAGNNGTFTVNASDRVGDRHGGHPDVENLASNLTTPKDIEVALPQTYEAQPGTAMASCGRSTMRRPASRSRSRSNCRRRSTSRSSRGCSPPRRAQGSPAQVRALRS